MALPERLYSVLIVSCADSFTASLCNLLPASHYAPVHTVGSISEARRALLEYSYDFILINAPLHDDPGTRFACDASERGPVVLLLVRSELHDDILARVSPHGVFTLPKPTSRQMITQALSWMISMRERLRKMEKKAVSLEDKMEEIRLVNRAKWALIQNLGMSEADAHRYIEKQAMDRCVPRREIANSILATYP